MPWARTSTSSPIRSRLSTELEEQVLESVRTQDPRTTQRLLSTIQSTLEQGITRPSDDVLRSRLGLFYRGMNSGTVEFLLRTLPGDAEFILSLCAQTDNPRTKAGDREGLLRQSPFATSPRNDVVPDVDSEASSTREHQPQSRIRHRLPQPTPLFRISCWPRRLPTTNPWPPPKNLPRSRSATSHCNPDRSRQRRRHTSDPVRGTQPKCTGCRRAHSPTAPPAGSAQPPEIQRPGKQPEEIHGPSVTGHGHHRHPGRARGTREHQRHHPARPAAEPRGTEAKPLQLPGHSHRHERQEPDPGPGALGKVLPRLHAPGDPRQGRRVRGSRVHGAARTLRNPPSQTLGARRTDPRRRRNTHVQRAPPCGPRGPDRNCPQRRRPAGGHPAQRSWIRNTSRGATPTGTRGRPSPRQRSSESRRAPCQTRTVPPPPQRQPIPQRHDQPQRKRPRLLPQGKEPGPHGVGRC